MEINGINMTSSVERSAQNDRKVKKTGTSSFMENFNQAKKENKDEFVKKRLKDIDEKADLLTERLDMVDFIEYKNIVKDFLAYITKNSNEYSKESKLSKNGDYRIFGIIKQIDDELEKIADDFLNNSVDKLKIIERMSGIKGLLLDISM
ncbi:MAG: YaaR family protein [Clostridia bacterium]|nr:YaaR family protein [Clostridia bacterium]